MTPNDKLPEEITEDILLSAKAFAAGMWSGISKHDANQRIYVASVWEAGATAWATWKVKHDELQAQAQRMADALEAFILWQGPTLKNWPVMEQAHKALQQFKDGKGKESVVGKCTKCGKHYPHANESGMCNKCEKEVENE